MEKTKSRILSIIGIAFAVPAIIVLISEYIQKGSIFGLMEFIVQKPGIILFDIVLTALLFALMTFLFKALWVSAAISGFVFYALSCVEYFKYRISGSHLVISDFLMAGSFGDITGFADLSISAHLIVALLLLVITVIAVKKTNLKLTVRFTRRLFCSALCVLCALLLVFPSGAMEKTYRMLDFDTEPVINSFDLNERFDNIGFLAFIYRDASDTISEKVEEPADYNRESVLSYLATEDAPVESRGVLPNIVFVLSESFSDLREISRDVPSGVYDSLDKAFSKGVTGTAVVPTFGGYTARTEFELLFGVPVNSIKNPEIPHYLLPGNAGDYKTFADFYKSRGYATTYIHPFSKTFYNRDEVYSKYGFDNMYFSDNLSVDPEHFKRYISDRTVYKQIEYQLKKDSGQSYIFATTMQNHQPFCAEGEKDCDELSYYLDGIKSSADSLYEFLCFLDKFDEKVIVVFLGDHFPFFTPQGCVYERLGINEQNISKLYYQKYLMYSNYGLSDTGFAEKPVSAFYLPHIVSAVTGNRKSAFINTMLGEMEKTPVYTLAVSKSGGSRVLDIIAYDRTLGERYSD